MLIWDDREKGLLDACIGRIGPTRIRAVTLGSNFTERIFCQVGGQLAARGAKALHGHLFC